MLTKIIKITKTTITTRTETIETPELRAVEAVFTDPFEIAHLTDGPGTTRQRHV